MKLSIEPDSTSVQRQIFSVLVSVTAISLILAACEKLCPDQHRTSTAS